MRAEEFDDCVEVRLPVLRPPFKVCEHRGDAGFDEEGHCIFEVFIEVGVEDALIHEVKPRADVEQDPAEIMELERSENVRIALDRCLNALSILADCILPAGLHLCDD